jgi:type I restriction enzyme R subunit
MPTIGQLERKTQNRVAALFRDELGYEHLGNWEEREGNRNIEEKLITDFLKQKQGYDDSLIARALFELNKAAGNTAQSIYDRNKAVYSMLRYGVQVKADAGDTKETVWLIDWEKPERNHFGIAEEVTVAAATDQAHPKRPDIVLYVNGIALGILELKRSTVSASEGIRQNLDNQKGIFIEHFFSTVQWIMAGNDTEGLRYGTIETKEKYYMTWKESGCSSRGNDAESALDTALLQICNKTRFLELIHDFIVFDAGTKKLCRHNQYFGVRAAQAHVKRREGGIIWHTQGSGKSLTMVWLAKWIREHARDARVLLITDRTELDEQIEKVFKGVNEQIYRTKSGADLTEKLNSANPWLIGSLIHKFGAHDDEADVEDIKKYLEEIKKALPQNFKPKGNVFVFVDECHRTQSGRLHEAMKTILPEAVFMGFTGTPLLKADKKRSIEVFGGYIHTYKFHEAVRDKVILDLRYEARDIDQRITSQAKIDQWFEAKTKGLTPIAKAQLKKRWGTMQKVLSSRSRLEQIVADILMDMETRDRLASGHGNALLVSGSIYEACKFYELFDSTDLHGRCAIVTSYKPSTGDLKGEESGEGETEHLEQYGIYQKMLAGWYKEPPEKALNRVEEFESAVKKKFIDDPGQMKLLIVVDKLLTGFDAPPATYLYIDKNMFDHGLFQAICRVNRLDGDDKEYGYIIDYKDLFKSLEKAVDDYTSGAFDAYDKEDVAGLLEERIGKAKEHLDEALESVRALCEPVEGPRDQAAYFRYFSSQESGNAEQLKNNEPQRLSLYKLTAALLRAYADIASEMSEAGYSEAEAATLKEQVKFYENLRNEVKLHSGDAIDLKRYEPAMRVLIDKYIQAEASVEVSKLNDLSLIQLIVERGADAVKDLPDGIQKNKQAVAETIENNVRRLIIDESPVNPKYYEQMSKLLDALIQQRRAEAISYKKYLEKIVELTRKAKNPKAPGYYPESLNTNARRSLFDNFGRSEGFAIHVDDVIRAASQDAWRGNPFKVRKVRNAIEEAVRMYLKEDGGWPTWVKETYPGKSALAEEQIVDEILELVKHQNEY